MKNGIVVLIIATVITLVVVVSSAVYAVAAVSTRTDGLERRMTTREQRDDSVAQDIAEIKTNVGILLERTNPRRQ